MKVNLKRSSYEKQISVLCFRDRSRAALLAQEDKLGKVSFPTSCDPKVQTFLEGIKLSPVDATGRLK